MPKNWRERLEEAMTQRKLSMRALSLEAGLGPSYVSGLLKERNEPTIENMLALCKVLDISASWLISGVNITPPRERILRFLVENPNAEAAILDLLQAFKR